MNKFFVGVAVVIACLLAFYGGYKYAGRTNNNTVVIKKDTVFQSVKPDPIYIERVLAKVKYLPKTLHDTITKQYRDTIIKTLPFIASLDTITKEKDTLSLKFYFPEKQFSAKVMLHTIFVPKEVKTTEYIKEKWYIKPIIILGSFIVGFGAGRI